MAARIHAGSDARRGSPTGRRSKHGANAVKMLRPGRGAAEAGMRPGCRAVKCCRMAPPRRKPRFSKWLPPVADDGNTKGVPPRTRPYSDGVGHEANLIARNVRNGSSPEVNANPKVGLLCASKRTPAQAPLRRAFFLTLHLAIKPARKWPSPSRPAP